MLFVIDDLAINDWKGVREQQKREINQIAEGAVDGCACSVAQH